MSPIKLGRLSRFFVALTIWSCLTAFVAIKAYDAGYIAGINQTTKIFLYFVTHRG